MANVTACVVVGNATKQRACLERDRRYPALFLPVCDDLRKRRNTALRARMASLVKRGKLAQCVALGRKEIRPLPATLVAIGACAVEAHNRSALVAACHRLKRFFPRYKDHGACARWLGRLGAPSP